MADSNPLIESVKNLQGLSKSLPNFTRRWNELKNHLDSIQKCIESRSKQLESPNEIAPETILVPRSELETVCQAMNGKGLRKFIIANLSDIETVKGEVKIALKSSPDPAKLALDCIGGFYLQGNKAYMKKQTPLPSVRQACIHVMELFLSSGADVSDSCKVDAEKAANLWRSRIVNEGGLEKANQLDALGLLLFVSSFGVTSDFTEDDLRYLIQSADPKETWGVLRNSQFLMEKIDDIIQGLLKKKMLAAGVEMAIYLGLEDKFHPVSILQKFEHESKETVKTIRREGQGSGAAQKEAAVMRLADLKLVLECLESFGKKLESYELGKELASDKLKEEVASLDRQVKMVKRNADELGGSQEKPKAREGKRPRPTPSGASVAKGAGQSVGNAAGSIGGARSGPLAGIAGPLSAGNGGRSYGWLGEGTFNKSMAGQGLFGPSSQRLPGMSGLSSAGVQGLLGSSSALGQSAVKLPAMGQNLLGSRVTPPGQSLLGQSTPSLGTGLPNLHRYSDSILGADSSYGSSHFGSSALSAYAPYLR